MADNLIISGKWNFFADTVMGGVSEGNAGYVNSDAGKALRLIGRVSTANNGGFIQVRTDVASQIAKGKTGIVLKAKGNGEQYFLHLRNSSTLLPWQYYQAGFQAGQTWREIRIPFTDFKKSSAFMSTAINTDTIKSIGIVAFGKDYSADISVVDLDFY
jgi:hypothetical protein